MDMCLITATRCKQGREPTFWEPRAVNRVSVQMMSWKIKTCVKDHKTERGTRSQRSKIWTQRGEASAEKLTVEGELSPGIGDALEFSSHSLWFNVESQLCQAW